MKRKIVSLILLLLITFILSCSQTAKIIKIKTDSATILINNSESGFSVIPIKIEDNLSYIEVTVDTTKIMLHVDIGDSDNNIRLSPALINRLNVKYTGKYISFGNLVGDKLKAKEFIIQNLSIGDFQFSNIKGFEAIYAKDFAPPNKDGTIGLALLRQFKVIIDYKGSSIILSRNNIFPEKYNVNDWGKVNFYDRGIGIVTNAEINKKKIKLVWDTGAQCSMLKKHVIGNNTMKKEGDLFEISKVFFGNAELGPIGFIIMNIKQPPVDGIVGYNFFVKHIIFVDFDNKLLKIKKI